MKNPEFVTILRWIIVIALPFLLTVGTLRLLISWNSPSYPEFEYGRIEPDPFGLTNAERLERAEATLAYLRRSEPAEEVIHLLEDLRLPESGEPLYNEREIGHMLDVKNVADNFRVVMWILAVIVIGGLIYLLARPESRVEGYRALFYGGILTAGVLLIFVVLILVSWNFIFTQFHEVLFPPETWTFRFSDSLIRLFPQQFWFDFGVLWTGLIFLEGVILAVVGYLLLRKT